MANICKKRLITKPFSYNIYSWCPQPTNYNKTQNSRRNNNSPYFCTAKAGTQGEDNISTYDYNVIIVDGAIKKLAYVACDYVT